jgi:subtilase family serine protease
MNLWLATSRLYGSRIARFRGLLLAALAVVVLSAGNANAQSQTISGNTPGFVSMGKDVGAEDSSKSIRVTLWLHPHNKSSLDHLAKELYDANSTNYRHWLKPAELKTEFAPTEEDVNTVKQFLLERNLKVVSVGPANFSVTAQGTVSEVERAFSVKIDKFNVGAESHRSNTGDPTIEGPASAIVAAVYGLDDYAFSHPVQQVKDLFSSKPGTAKSLHGAGTDGIFYSGQCFPGTETETFTTSGTLPFATYSGNAFGQATGGLGSLPPCGYDPAEIYTAYNLNGLYAKGFHGEGQTIVILDWYGSTHVTQDANLFSSLNKLPPLTPSNFNIIYYPYNCNCQEVSAEINLDVEWAHAIAPGANIVLLVPPSPSFADVDNATVYAITYGLGNTISGSFGAPERILSPVILNQENLIAELAAVSGISTNYSSGDYGDFIALGIPPTVSAPADLPFATGVGGVSLALNTDNSIAWQAGWGNNETAIVAPPSLGGYVVDPPIHFGFAFGSGGGPSGYFAKPRFQKGVPGSVRQVPDISWLADPFTGAEIVIFDGTDEAIEVIGGTSLATPMFSGLWAIANQEAGVPLGQAAPYLYSMPAGTITDIVPVISPTSPTGIIQDTNAPYFHHYSAPQLAKAGVFPLNPPKYFYSAIYHSPFDFEWDIVTFGTDSSLTIHAGWDNVTGLGTPNGQAFADAFALKP